MKHRILSLTLIITFFILFQNSLKSQDYFPFPTDSATWYSMYSWPEMVPPYVSYFTIKYEAIGDTVINGLTYTRLYKGPVNDTESTDYYGGYRVDYDNECVYFIENDSYTESLLYDFRLTPGDTITITGSDYAPYNLVCLDTSSMIIKGISHKSYLIYSYLSNGTSCYTQWVKGIGSLRKPTETNEFCGVSFEWAYDLTCFYYKDEKIYEWEMNPYFTGCIGSSVIGIEEHSIESLQVVPNPVEDVSRLSGYKNDQQKIHYRVIDYTGRTIYGCSNILPSEVEIKRSDYSLGIYFLEIYSNKFQKIQVLKFLIK